MQICWYGNKKVAGNQNCKERLFTYSMKKYSSPDMFQHDSGTAMLVQIKVSTYPLIFSLMSTPTPRMNASWRWHCIMHWALNLCVLIGTFQCTCGLVLWTGVFLLRIILCETLNSFLYHAPSLYFIADHSPSRCISHLGSIFLKGQCLAILQLIDLNSHSNKYSSDPSLMSYPRFCHPITSVFLLHLNQMCDKCEEYCFLSWIM